MKDGGKQRGAGEQAAALLCCFSRPSVPPVQAQRHQGGEMMMVVVVVVIIIIIQTVCVFFTSEVSSRLAGLLGECEPTCRWLFFSFPVSDLLGSFRVLSVFSCFLVVFFSLFMLLKLTSAWRWMFGNLHSHLIYYNNHTHTVTQ